MSYLIILSADHLHEFVSSIYSSAHKVTIEVVLGCSNNVTIQNNTILLI